VLGILSLIFWSLIITITIKYVAYVLRADNRGEGGILALMALATSKSAAVGRSRTAIVFLGLFGAALLYGLPLATIAYSISSTNLVIGLGLLGLYTLLIVIATIAHDAHLSARARPGGAGADGLACVSAGAGGHTGFISPFAFISAARELTDGLVIVGGGIADGYGVAGAIAAGADLVYMGTRFIATRESRAVDEYKQMVVDSTLDDLLVSASITGTPATWLKPSLRRAGYDPEQMPEKPQRNYDSSQQQQVAKRWKDLWSAGQGIGAVRAIEPMSAVVDSLAREYDAAVARIISASASCSR
jgi:hypothetical protein